MKKVKLLSACILLTSAGVACAAPDATLNFTGTIILPTCAVNPASANQTIDLGSAKTVDFLAVGSTQNPKAFQIALNNCAAGTNVTMTVNGTADSSATSVLTNSGGAAQVGVQLLKSVNTGDTTGTPIVMGNTMAMGVVDGTNTMTIPMVAQFYRLGTMTAGTVVASATVQFTYN